jgi:ribonuclease E
MGKAVRVEGVLPLDVASYLQNKKRKELADLEDRYGVTIQIQGDPALSPGEGNLDFVRQDQTPQAKT